MSKKELNDKQKIYLYNSISEKAFSLIDNESKMKKPKNLTDDMILEWFNIIQMDKRINRDNQDCESYIELIKNSYSEEYIKDTRKKYGNHAWLLFPDIEKINLIETEKALAKGGNVHIFLSGGGLRVVCIEDKNKKSIGYGEHFCIEEALRHADEDLTCYLSYEKKYSGKNAKYTHYYTGSSFASSNLDFYIRKGGTIDFSYNQNSKEFISVIHDYEHVDIPEWVNQKCMANKTAEFPYRDDETGIIYVCKAYQFPNSEWGTTQSVVFCPSVMKGKEYYRRVTKSGKSKESLWQAIFNSIVAKSVINFKED